MYVISSWIKNDSGGMTPNVQASLVRVVSGASPLPNTLLLASTSKDAANFLFAFPDDMRELTDEEKEVLYKLLSPHINVVTGDTCDSEMLFKATKDIMSMMAVPMKKMVEKSDLSEKIPESLVDILVTAGYNTLESVKKASDEEMLSINGIGKSKLKTIRDAIE